MDELNQEGQDLEPAGDEATPEKAQEPQIPKKEFDKIFARAKQAEEAEKRLKEELASYKAKPEAKEVSEDFHTRLDRIELRSMDYSPDEVDHIMAVGGLKALENPLVKSGIESMRIEKKAEQGTPAPSPRLAEERPIEMAKLPKKDTPFDRRAYLLKKQTEALDKAKAAGRLRVE